MKRKERRERGQKKREEEERRRTEVVKERSKMRKGLRRKGGRKEEVGTEKIIKKGLIRKCPPAGVDEKEFFSLEEEMDSLCNGVMKKEESYGENSFGREGKREGERGGEKLL